MIAIVGGGCSGLLVAANLRRFAPDVSYRVYESGPVGGHAYARAEPYHLLNVRAGRMSAWTDRPEDFVRWSHSTTSPLEPDQFAPRVRYGKYLRSLVDPSCLVERTSSRSTSSTRNTWSWRWATAKATARATRRGSNCPQASWPNPRSSSWAPA